jgi:putative OPT family oligopeptide transporter
MIGREFPDAIIYPGTKPIAAMASAEIFRSYVRLIGVGAIATAGIFGIIKYLRVVAGSFKIAAKTFQHGEDTSLERTDTDISMVTILIGVVVSSIGAAIFFGSLVNSSFSTVAIALVLTILFSFFFASVAANAIATTSRNPVSGMTMLTIIISSVVLLKFGMSGTTGMFFVMAIAGMVCTALSVSGQVITDLKTGYWLGSTPAAQERVKFVGVIASSIAVGLTIVMLAKVFQFGEAAPGNNNPILASPQASIMKALVETFMTGKPIAYILFGAGAAIAISMEMLKVPALIVALGMYLPLELNSPALVGGFVSYLIDRKATKAGALGRTIRERGVIIASGFMAGGALGGVFGAALRLNKNFSETWVKTPFYDNEGVSQIVSAAFFVGLCVYLWIDANRKVED